MEKRVISEPQRTYLLEFLHTLGPIADDFVVAGAQAMKFMVKRARATKDIDFVLDVIKLRGEPVALGDQLKQLGYVVVDGSRNFQFEKPIPNSPESMRIEFMAPDEFKREKDFRVDVQNGVHARACTGGGIAERDRRVRARPFDDSSMPRWVGIVVNEKPHNNPTITPQLKSTPQ